MLREKAPQEQLFISNKKPQWSQLTEEQIEYLADLVNQHLSKTGREPVSIEHPEFHYLAVNAWMTRSIFACEKEMYCLNNTIRPDELRLLDKAKILWSSLDDYFSSGGGFAGSSVRPVLHVSKGELSLENENFRHELQHFAEYIADRVQPKPKDVEQKPRGWRARVGRRLMTNSNTFLYSSLASSVGYGVVELVDGDENLHEYYPVLSIIFLALCVISGVSGRLIYISDPHEKRANEVAAKPQE
jgi:hypothetical protein